MKFKLLLAACLFTVSVSFAQSTVLTSFYPIYIMALNVAGGVPGIKIELLALPSTGCLHDYSLTPSDMGKIENASLFIVNGLGMEPFLDKVLHRYPRVPVLVLSDGIQPIKAEGRVNTHIWLSIPLAKLEIRHLADGLSRWDPGHATLYQRNASDYIQKLNLLENEMKAELAVFKGEPVISFYEAFSYFANDFGLLEKGRIIRESGTIPSAKEMGKLVETVRREKIRALFVEPQCPSGVIRLLASQTDAGVVVLDPAVSGPLSKDAYRDMMRRNVASIKKGIKVPR